MLTRRRRARRDFESSMRNEPDVFGNSGADAHQKHPEVVPTENSLGFVAQMAFTAQAVLRVLRVSA